MNDKYAIYVGDNIKTVSLWVRQEENEYPIYANTRGQCAWYSFRRDVYENAHPTELSETCKEWLAHFHRIKSGLIENRESMFLRDVVEADRPDNDPEAWYETEILNAIGEPGYTPEQEDLLEWAYNEVQE